MQKEYFDILEKWAEYSKFDAEQSCFRFGSFEFEMNRVTKRIAHINDVYDDSGLLSIMTIKKFFFKYMKETDINLLECLKHPEELKPHIEMYNLFMSDIVTKAEDYYIGMINEMAKKIIGSTLIGEENYDSFRSKVFDKTEVVIKSLDSCRFEVYQKGGEVGQITNISTSIHIFDSLTECLLTLSNAKDGMYLCYINVSNSPDSYFGFFVKNNGNIFSINERIGESYRGSHQHSRTGRWSEDKQDGLFPYDFIFSYSDYDSKGYSRTYIIDDENLSFFHLGEDVYIPILLAMVFLARNYSNKLITEQPVYIDSMLSFNLKSITEDSNELALIEENSIVQYHKSLNLEYDIDKVMDGSALSEVSGENGSVIADNRNQLMVDLYGDGFEIPKTILHTQLALPGKEDEYYTEFIGDEKTMRSQGYYEIRLQLEAYIRDKMYEEFVNFGKMKGVYNWFETQVDANLTSIEHCLAKKYYDIQNGGKNLNGHFSSADANIKYDISFVENEKYPSGFYPIMYIPNRDVDSWDYRDTRTGTKCSMWFVVRPKDYLALEELFHNEVPKIVKGWRREGHYPYGNSILNMTDPVEKIGTPFEESNSKRYEGEHVYTTFAFAIGYSKRGLSRMLKENADAKPTD